jgi:hypothetical protein
MPRQRVAMTRKHTCSFSRHVLPELSKFFVLTLETEGAGNAGCALHPRSRVPIAQTKAHTSIQGSGEHTDIPCAMALRLTPRSPWRRIPFVTIACGLKVLSTRLARHRLRRLGISNGCQDHTASPYAASSIDPSASLVLPAEVPTEALKHRSSCTPSIAHEVHLALRYLARAMLPRPPHPIPTFSDDGRRPSSGMRRLDL